MGKLSIMFTAILICLLARSVLAHASTVPIGDLIEKSIEYDNNLVEVTGEVIGDVMFRGNMAWVNIGDRTGVIGVWISSKQAEKIRFAGDYQHQGDTVKVTGIFKRDNEKQGGDLSIEGKMLETIKFGKAVHHSISYMKLGSGVILSFMALLLYGLKKKVKIKSYFK